MDKEAILVSFLIKGEEIKARTSIIKNINIDQFEGIEITTDNMTSDVTPGSEAETSRAIEEDDQDTTEEYNQERIEEKTENSEQAHPERTRKTGLKERGLRRTNKEEKTKKSKKRKQYSEIMELEEEMEEEQEEKEWKRPKKGRTEKDDPLAIDGRRKPDLSKRIRIKGRLGGYMEGYEPAKSR